MVKKILAELEARAKELKVNTREWLAKAGVAESTFYRWKQDPDEGGTVPNLATLEKLEKSLDKIARRRRKSAPVVA